MHESKKAKWVKPAIGYFGSVEEVRKHFAATATPSELAELDRLLEQCPDNTGHRYKRRAHG